MSYVDIEIEREPPVATVFLARPSKLNAYTPDMGEELVDAFRRLLADDKVSVIVLSGRGDGFCAGADRACLAGAPSRSGIQIGDETFIRSFALELFKAPKPIIAAINGVASGIGVTMTLPLDVRIASSKARFDLPFAKLGIVPGLGSSFLLERLVGAGRASELILTNARLSAEEALRIGLVSEVTAPEKLMEHAWSMAKSMASAPHEFAGRLKRLLGAGAAGLLEEAMLRERALVDFTRSNTSRA